MEASRVPQVQRASNDKKQLFGLERFYKSSCSQDEQELHFYRIQRVFRFYRSNLYILNRAALKIQHFFFERMAKLPQQKVSERRVKSPECSDVKITENSLSQPLFPSTHEDDIVSIPSSSQDSWDGEVAHLETQPKQEISFMSHSHITSEERYHRSLRHSVMKNSATLMNEPTPRDITPNGVSKQHRFSRQQVNQAPLTPMAAGKTEPQEGKTSELQEFLMARRSEIQKKEAQFMRKKDSKYLKPLDFSSPDEGPLQRSAYSQRSIFTGQSGHSRRDSTVKKHKDQSYTDAEGRVHHPKKWGASQCGWKAHDIDSLQHLIEEAWKNNLETKIKQVAISTTPPVAKHSTPNSHRSNDSVSKPRFVTNCDWVSGENKDEKKESLDMGEYFNKERQERANSRNKSKSAVSKSPVPSPKPPLPPKESSKLDDEDLVEHEEVCELPKGNSNKAFSKKYSKQTSWRQGEVEAIEGLIQKASGSGARRHHKSYSSLQRPVTPCTRICINKVNGRGSFFSPNTERCKDTGSCGKVKYELQPVELNISSRTPTMRQRNSFSSKTSLEHPKRSFFSSRGPKPTENLEEQGSNQWKSRKYSKVESKVKQMLKRAPERSTTPKNYLKAHSKDTKKKENEHGFYLKKELQRLDNEFEQNRSSKGEDWVRSALDRVPFKQVS